MGQSHSHVGFAHDRGPWVYQKVMCLHTRYHLIGSFSLSSLHNIAAAKIRFVHSFASHVRRGYHRIKALLRTTILSSSYDLRSKGITSQHSIHVPRTSSTTSFQDFCDDFRVRNADLVGHEPQLLDDPWLNLRRRACI